MYARNVSISLKPNTASEFTQTLEKDILPLLRKQNGFKDEITFLGADGKDAMVVDGTPKVLSYEVANSTFHKIAARN